MTLLVMFLAFILEDLFETFSIEVLKPSTKTVFLNSAITIIATNTDSIQPFILKGICQSSNVV